MEFDGPRGTRTDEAAALGELIGSVFAGPPFNINMGFLLFAEENLPLQRIFLHQGRPVSHVGLVEFDLEMFGCPVRVAEVGSVCTAEQFRGQGLAGRLLDDSWDLLRADGVDLVLVSGSRRLYLDDGCGNCRPNYRFMVQPGEGELAGTICPPHEHINAMLRLYHAEPIHFVRTDEQLEKVVCPRPIMDKVVFAMLSDRAYYLGWRTQTEAGQPFIETLEYAGDRALLVQAAPALAQEFGAPLRFHVPDWETDFRAALAQVAEQTALINSPEGTVKILALGRLMEKLRPFWQPKVGREIADQLGFFQFRDQAEIRLGDESLQLSGAMPAELVFGTTENKSWGTGQLAEVLQQLFPLPGPRYGLNYL